ncbi:MAG: glutamate formimidoyltransferase [Candidatus Dormibacteraeota bacterium]|nr:glutamate formimidoyltransferase [Candidatus Dormibacteraeota bacterium]
MAAAVEAVAGVRLLDRHSDVDHNRSVLTFAGPWDAVPEAAFRTAQVAIRDIDMTQHQGSHPRMGAVDVIPMVPLAQATMEDAVEVARALARRIGEHLEMPAWLYGAAAAPGHPAELRAIRGDGFEALLALGDDLPAPDFGPHALHATAGGTAIGARAPLVAFNVMLDTNRLEVAKRLARVVRASSGGLPGVHALGVMLPSRGRAQVTMNLLDHQRTGIAAVLARLRQAADDEGVGLAEAELVGLAPAEALVGLEDDDLPGLPTAADSLETRLTESGL